MRTIMTLLTVTSILIGCSDAGNTISIPNGNVTATTNKRSYSVGENIEVVLKNNSHSTVYFIHCNYRIGFWIERKDNETWVDAGNVAILCLALYPGGRKEFPSGSASHDTISLWAVACATALARDAFGKESAGTLLPRVTTSNPPSSFC